MTGGEHDGPVGPGSGGQTPPPYGTPAPYGMSPPYGPPAPYGTPAPYGAPPPYAPPYGPPSYGAALPPGYGAPPGYLPAPSSPSASAIVLVVLAGLATTSCWFTLAGLPALVLGIKALTEQSKDPAGAARLARIGWAVFGGLVAVEVLAVVVLVAAGG